MIKNSEQSSRTIRNLADEFLTKACEISPLTASLEGFSDYDDRIGDLSPASDEKHYELAKETLSKLHSSEIANDDEKLCADVLAQRCVEIIDDFELKDFVRGINVITNPLDSIHSSCYNIDVTDEDALEKRQTKIAEIPKALGTFKETLIYGVTNDCLPRITQMSHLADNCVLYSRDKLFEDTPASNAFLELEAFIRKEIIPFCDTNDYVGKEIYSRFSSRQLGKKIDFNETYFWGWEEIRYILNEIDEVVSIINPGGNYLETIDKLNADAALTAFSPDELLTFLQGLLDKSISDLEPHFDIDDRLKTIEAHVIEEAGSSAMYYSAPSDDFSRPGRTYYPLNGKTEFPLWEEVTTCYHEGLPGHHLHLGAIKCSGDKFSNFQKTSAYNAGFGEGWALYAERLMHDLGLYEREEYVFGMLNASLFRALRVVMDIGLHCQLEIPEDAPELFPRGQIWTKEMSIELLMRVIGIDAHFAKDEVHRYLGWIGQAVSYKYGEKTIREILSREKIRLGPNFSLKEFHSRMLNVGHVGLGQLESIFQSESANSCA